MVEGDDRLGLVARGEDDVRGVGDTDSVASELRLAGRRPPRYGAGAADGLTRPQRGPLA